MAQDKSPRPRARAPGRAGMLLGGMAAYSLAAWGVKKLIKWLEQSVDGDNGAVVKHDRLMFLKLNEYEKVLAQQVVNPEDIEVDEKCMLGLKDIMDDLKQEVMLPLEQPQLFNTTLLKHPKGVLLYGPPGTGKTMLAKALAKSSNCVFLNLTASSLLSKWLGDANKHVKAVFSLAAKLQPCIVFIDEVDALLARRGASASEHEAMLQVKTEFMQLWDGMESSCGRRVVVMGATNRPAELDDAVLRRFTHKHEVGLPTAPQRTHILVGYLRKHNEELKRQAQAQTQAQAGPRRARGAGGEEGRGAAAGALVLQGSAAVAPQLLDPNSSVLKMLAASTEGWSGSDLMELCSLAAQRALADSMADPARAKGGPVTLRPITCDDVTTSLRRLIPQLQATGSAVATALAALGDILSAAPAAAAATAAAGTAATAAGGAADTAAESRRVSGWRKPAKKSPAAAAAATAVTNVPGTPVHVPGATAAQLQGSDGDSADGSDGGSGSGAASPPSAGVGARPGPVVTVPSGSTPFYVPPACLLQMISNQSVQLDR
ncbi:hypothetical protein HYH03_013722 [Edaphochlamys debaryana]|uniref:AAA+ ATPase domain-containing protein n=1 Tax=Edaphochlamys debaryana TaxID=47281 RepID=A0A836BU93_9CHLO|nr:hypothetical protein HYH03_013722 [Edaphochlamys debaryana]|eukprot:KAG2487723.1 hypothetical protein HYH03_013722 [Edaphochlamys debaryana]